MDDLTTGFPRVFDAMRHVYTVISPRAGGLMIGINLNPDRYCNFKCVYCDVEHGARPSTEFIDLALLNQELAETLELVRSGQIREHPAYRNVPAPLLALKQVAFSGDGEPTHCAQFAEAVEVVAHVRAVGRWPFFKMVLITNATGLDRPAVQAGLNLFTTEDEVWAKLDVGTQDFMNRINGGDVPLQTVLDNILALARKRPVGIQSLFVELDGSPPSPVEIVAYTERLHELVQAGANISAVQIYSASRKPAGTRCRHLPLRNLSQIAQAVRSATGLKVQVY